MNYIKYTNLNKNIINIINNYECTLNNIVKILNKNLQSYKEIEPINLSKLIVKCIKYGYIGFGINKEINQNIKLINRLKNSTIVDFHYDNTYIYLKGYFGKGKIVNAMCLLYLKD